MSCVLPGSQGGAGRLAALHGRRLLVESGRARSRVEGSGPGKMPARGDDAGRHAENGSSASMAPGVPDLLLELVFRGESGKVPVLLWNWRLQPGGSPDLPAVRRIRGLAADGP